MDNSKSVFDSLLNEIERTVGPNIPAATHRKIARAKAALARFEQQVEEEASRERAMQDYVVILASPEHGTVKISRRALTAAEAEQAAKKLAPGFEVVSSQLGK